ncbi:hypothetical protein JAAARDRAFT_29190 [Jaapia argillacea MUCL 33604]|uniref:Potassium transport protein n=1 Tax=Jaapia argillacea MUCL 33604 TaxID=933084 RepID=A0A067Q810_9AGAM|nr:hypothetical protein JAAARDRAFT_29190 [Jaapia argillacea MUCL 33604]
MLRISWNYYRLHLTFFTLHPIIWSGIFYAANGQYKVSYVDAFFLCFSAQTVTGLSTINLSTTTGFQQFILFWLMVTGSYTTTSWVMVLVRQRYFISRCSHVISQRRSGGFGTSFKEFRTKTIDALGGGYLWKSATHSAFPQTPPVVTGDANIEEKSAHQVEGDNPGLEVSTAPETPTDHSETMQDVTSSGHREGRRSSNNLTFPEFSELRRTTSPMSMGSIPERASVPFEEPPNSSSQPLQNAYRTSTRHETTLTKRTRQSSREATVLASVAPTEPYQEGFGGFSGPLTLASQIAQSIAPGLSRTIQRKMTLPEQQTLHPIPENSEKPSRNESGDWTDDLEGLNAKVVSYIKTGALWVGRNSLFDTEQLTDEQLEEIGGVEYRAIRVLSWLVPAYFIGTQFCTFIIFTGYLMNVHRFDNVFTAQSRLIPVPWFSAFQAVSAYTGGGLSLVDEGMVPFISAYTLVISLGFLIAAGNMLMPAFLRLIVWCLYHMLPKRSSHREPLQFLLDHPRRCFVYLFPSHQTWFLVAVYMFLTAIEWAGFLVFDIGLSVTESIPRGQRVLAGLFQSQGVRASGFSIVNLGALAPAVKVLYIVMMYISAYPISMSVRSTNVYEERSVGVFYRGTEDEEEPKGEIFSKYLGWHIRRQLAFDLWWLAAALLLICIIERGNIMNPSNDTWFNQFQIMFEIVSAYATVGLSLGIPTENYSFSGALEPGSKLILCAVMLRGRHRDLPVAVDRAILLPHEFSRIPNSNGQHIIPDIPDRHDTNASRKDTNKTT